MKEHIFDCGGYNGTARFNKTQNELSNFILQSSEKGGSDVAKAICDLNTEDMTPTAPTDTEKAHSGLEKDVWMNDYQTQK